MAQDYSVETIKQLEGEFRRAELLRPMKTERYDAGDELVYSVRGVVPARTGEVRLRVEKFVGGGFAGQVYRVEVLEVNSPDGPIEGLEAGGFYAMKILIPPSRFSQFFRDAVYQAGFQSPFALQVNPSAARAGALWQKFLRRGAAIRFGDERAVVDILATFVDERLGSCGELSEWVDGRNWAFEVNDRLDLLKKWCRGKLGGADKAGSPEYCAKKKFMADVVKLFHDMGAPELARQYEWSTCKSQPNAMKRRTATGGPADGLVAVDFRAGLALLPYLPMSPGDVRLIFKGLARGSLVQFDRGNLDVLRRFIDANSERFADMQDAFTELVFAEQEYRRSQIDVTHNHLHLFDPARWSKISHGEISAAEISGRADRRFAAKLRMSKMKTVLFVALNVFSHFLVSAGMLAATLTGLAVLWTIVGRFAPEIAVDLPLLWMAGISVVLLAILPGAIGRPLKFWGRSDYRAHFFKALTSPRYLFRAFRAKLAERLISWHRKGRVSGEMALRLMASPLKFWLQWPLSLLPAGLHRFCVDGRYRAERLHFIFVRPIKLFFNADAREQWLLEMLAEGERRHMLTAEDAATIRSRVKEPFIQKYLKSLAVHVCTLPVTQIVSVTVAIWYKVSHGLTWSEAWDEMFLILAAFQITPISPGSLVRGLYVVYLVIKERDFKNYNIAVFLGFFKYIGYLAFPIQMAYRYPVLARFMAGHWATGAVHIVPVFGEHGALLEHKVFDWFYNLPLTIRGRMKRRSEFRSTLKTHNWTVAPVAAVGLAMFTAGLLACNSIWSAVPTFGDIWPLDIVIAAIMGACVAIFAGGAKFPRRVILAAVCGVAVGVIYPIVEILVRVHAAGENIAGWDSVAFYFDGKGWSVFIVALFTTLSAILTEINLPEVKQRRLAA